MEQFKYFGYQCAVEIGAPEGVVTGWIFDDRSGVADQGRIKLELLRNGPGASVATACTKYRADSDLSRACDGSECARTQGAVGVEKCAVDVECEDLKAMSRHR
jgi:hypothetical protein